ncbi:MAG: sugar ABC transporter ATP-binding protein [Synergistaceae bacterium]|jgi:ribose transport system ATP-binding protein|nr:sugar ABC transporter ATP-binding protein [Synergistaceae bacterium]
MGEYLAECEHVDKSFFGVKVLDDVSFDVRAGEVVALLGENGAGKSTLVKILSGVYARDGGTLKVFGAPVGNLTPREAQNLGISIIHQELNLCSHLTVAENIFLGRETVKNGVLAKREMSSRAAGILKRLNLDMDPDAIVGSLSVSKQQLVEIAKALSTNARILIMDEPTSALTAKEIEDLFVIIRKLRDEGDCGIVYISHRLDELKHIADRVVIMRDGRFITSAEFGAVTMDEIISHMVGREIKEKFPRVPGKRGKKIFEVKNLSAGKMVKDVSFDLYEGEIVGISGLMGAGRTELTRAIFGIDPKDSGHIYLEGSEISIRRPSDAISHGVVLAPEDRKKDGLCTRLSVRENISLPNLDSLCDGGFVNRGKEKLMVYDTIRNLAIRLSGPEINAGSLSGGNQQKVVVGKWLARNSKVVIFDEPTRGIDVAAKVEIYNLMNDLKKNGIGVMFVSSEMPEVMGFADRIIVMCDGRITGEFMSGEATQNKILEKATQFEAKELSLGGAERGKAV